MKMKKALSIILGGALLVGSSSSIFANDGVTLSNKVLQQSAVQEEVSIQTTDTPTVTIEVLDEIINKVDGEIIIDLGDKELEQELLELIEDILSELEEEVDEDEKEELEDKDDEDQDKDDENDDNNENQDVLEELYRKLLKYQLVYDRVPAQAKPAIEKNMKNMQLRIVEHMLEMNEDLEKLIPEINIEEIQKEISSLNDKLENEELTEEEKQELMNSIAALETKISNHEEIVKLVEFVNENENWQKELKNNIHKEFKEEKAKIKAESKLNKEKIKQVKEELPEQIKANKPSDKSKEKDIEVDKKITNEKEIKNDNNDKISNKKTEEKSHPVKEAHPGKGRNNK